MPEYSFYEKEANETLSHFKFSGKSVLDVGTRSGIMPVIMIEKGATHVVGIDPDASRFHELDIYPVQKDKITLLQTTLQDYTPGKLFDVITVFLWNIPIKEYDDVAKKMKALLQPGGHILVGIVDEVYKNESDQVSVKKLFEKYFKTVTVMGGDHTAQWILDIHDPRINARGGKSRARGRGLSRRGRSRSGRGRSSKTRRV